MTTPRRFQPEPPARRSDVGSVAYTLRDNCGQRLVADMQFLSLDHLGQFLAPGLEPACDTAGDATLTSSLHGGKRDHLPWPRDYKKRLHATAELVRRWEKKQGYVQTWKPWEHEPAWVRMTEAGLRALGLPWSETPFPENRQRLRSTAHCYQVNKRRIALARGGADAPAHDWLCERALLHEQLTCDPNLIRAHRPDGVLLLKADGSFPLKRGETVIEEIALKAGQQIAIEVELSRKGFARLGEGILPSLLRTYDFAWYFCGNAEVYQTIIAARRDYLHTNEERKRIRILLLEESIAEEDTDQ